jgi:hypothetical protein
MNIDTQIVRENLLIKYTILIKKDSVEEFSKIPFKNVIKIKLKCGKNLFWIACYFGAYNIVKYIFELYYKLLKQQTYLTPELTNVSKRIQYLFD